MNSLLIFLPAAIANMVPVIVSKIPILKYPIDFGLKIKDKPILGKNKTWRGLIFGTAIAVLIAFIQNYLGYFPVNGNVYLIGFLLGFGALVGDLIESIIKRRIGIKPGNSLPILDQIDWMIGAYLFVLIVEHVFFIDFIYATVIYGLLHPIAHYLGYVLKLTKTKI